LPSGRSAEFRTATGTLLGLGVHARFSKGSGVQTPSAPHPQLHVIIHDRISAGRLSRRHVGRASLKTLPTPAHWGWCSYWDRGSRLSVPGRNWLPVWPPAQGGALPGYFFFPFLFFFLFFLLSFFLPFFLAIFFSVPFFLFFLLFLLFFALVSLSFGS